MSDSNFREMGVLIFEGMKVGVLDRDLTVSTDDAGKTSGRVVISTSYNVIPLWLRSARDYAIEASKAADAVKNNWLDDADKQKSLLVTELIPSMQVFVGCGTALDALYAQLKSFAKIDDDTKSAWKNNKTSRAIQIAHVIGCVYKLDNHHSKAFRQNIEGIINFRNEAVHPTHDVKRVCTRPDVPVGVDWRFSQYRSHNAQIAFQQTIAMFIHLYEKKCSTDSVNENMDGIFKSLMELGVVSRKAQDNK